MIRLRLLQLLSGRSRRFWNQLAHSRLCTTAAPEAVSDAPKFKEAKVGNVKADGKTVRWYKEVSVKPFSIAEEKGWLVLLDGRIVKTPADNRLLVPTRRLAHLLAMEWEMQQKTVVPSEMPLMTLAATALDQLPSRRGTVVDSLMSHLKTDSVCLRDESPAVVTKQEQIHNPLIKWFSEQYQLPPVTINPSIFYVEHPEQTMTTIQWMLFHQDDWTLAALDALSQNTKSLILPLALWHQRISAPEALRASRVEEDHGIEQYGEVEGAHDLDRVHAKVAIAAGTVFLHALPAPKPIQ